MTDSFATPIPAASVAVIRDGRRGLELLYLRRNHTLAFAPSTWVFPGGRIDRTDHNADSSDDQALATAKRAAVREAAEEANLALRPEELRHLYRWTTPEQAPRRFATWFFIAVASSDIAVTVDNQEIIEHRWASPSDALALRARGEMQIAVPVFVLSQRLAEFASVREAQDHMSAWQAEVMEPRSFLVERGRVALYEGDAGFERRDPERQGKRHRMWMLDSEWRYERDD